MRLLRSVIMAFSMFSRVPTLKVEWERENMRYMLAAFPLVGCVEGALLYAWYALSGWLGFGPVLFAAGMTLLPVLYTGGVHLDGFCDTVDALFSRGDAEKKRSILKDPHTGAFAVIFVCAYLIALLALYTELPCDNGGILLACLIPVISRTVSGFAGVRFQVSGEKGTLAEFQSGADKTAATAVLCAWFIACAVYALLLELRAGIAMLVCAKLCGIYVRCMSKRQFGGMNGDLAGYLLQLCELVMLIALIFTQKAVLL